MTLSLPWPVALLLFLIICISSESHAQFSGATVIGVVQDSSRAVIPSAKLRLINIETGAENDSSTNREGGFLLDGVLQGSYTLQVESPGFATTQVRGLTLAAGDTKNLLIRLKVGSIAETVNVDASGLVMNTTNAAVGMVADQRLVENVPLNGRSFPDLILLTPGIVTQSPQAASQGNSTVGEFSVNGQQPSANAFYVDGIAANTGLGSTSRNARLASTGSVAGTTALGTTQTLVSVDALQEFRVLTSTYSAEYGRTPGGQFNFATRPGTEGFHGSAYEYYRHDSLDAYDYFQYPSNQRSFNQFDSGATFGGPFARPWLSNASGKTFVFGSYEGLYIAQPTPPLFQYLPATSLLNTAPTGIANILNAFGGYASEILDSNGQPTGLGYNELPDSALPSHVNAFSVRFDHTLTQRASFFLRYADTPSFGQTEQVTALSRSQVRSQSLTLGSTVQFAGEKSDEFRLGYAGNHSNLQTNIEPGFPLFQQVVDLVGLLGVPPSFGSVRGQVYLHVNGAGDSLIQTDQASSSLTQWNVRNTFSWPIHNHLLKLGTDERRLVTSVIPTELSVQANFFDRAAMARNSVSQLVVSSSTPASPRVQQLSLFVDDAWQISNSVNLSLGLRWELNPAPRGENGHDAFTAAGDIASPATLRVAPRGTELWCTTWFNLAPRVGAAWSADNRAGHELVLRGGAGVFFDTSNQAGLSAFQGAGFYSSQAFPDVPLPVTTRELDVSTVLGPSFNNTLVFAFPRHLQLPYSLQWNLSVEKAFGKYQSLTLSYVGANGRRLLHEQRNNVHNSNPELTDVSYFPGGLTSNYEAFQAKFQRTFPKGVEGLASYTWAHALDYGSTSPQFPLHYASSDLDVRHNLEGGLIWTLPRFDGWWHLSRILMGDWTVDGRLIARTAFPVDLAGNFFFDNITGEPYYSGVDLIPNRRLYYRNAALAGGRGFNGGPTNDRPLLLPAFALPSRTEAGNAPRNLMRGFGTVQANFGGHRTFHVYDRLQLEIGGELFNLFNHPNFGYIDPYLTDSVFGQSIRMLNQSFGSTGALYQEGGPRAAQFHVRFVF